MTEIITDWLKYAVNDLNVAINCMENMYPQPLEIICYHCQQSAEKYLKAFLISNNWVLEKTHDLDYLLKIAIKYNNNLINIKEACNKLNDYSTQARYPNGVELIEADAVSAIKNAKQIQQIILKEIIDE